MREFYEFTPAEQFVIKLMVANALKIKEPRRKVLVEHDISIKKIIITLIGNDVVKYRWNPKLKKWLTKKYKVKLPSKRITYSSNTPPDEKRYPVSISLGIARKMIKEYYEEKSKNGVQRLSSPVKF